MNWTVPWILKQPNKSFVINETVLLPKDMYRYVDTLLEIDRVHIVGKGYYDDRNDRVFFDLKIDTDLVLECSVSLEPVQHPVDVEHQIIFGYSDDELTDIYHIKKEKIDLLPIIVQLILMEVPIRVVKEDVEAQKIGNGWQVISEKTETIDPRFAKLSELLINK